MPPFPPGGQPPLPAPGAFGPPPIPGVSNPAPGPKDRMTQLAELLGQVKAEDSVSASDDFAQGLSLMESAAQKDPKLLPLYQKVMAVINEQQAPPTPPGSGMMGPVSPSAGMPQPPPM